jgi:CHAD domain-containing protein
MSYQLERGETAPAGIRRIATEQIDEALALLADPHGDLDRVIHNARKCFKRLRAVLRLVRSGLGKTVYRRENALYRDLGRRLSSVRHSAVKLQTLQALVAPHTDRLILDAAAHMRDRLAREHQATVREMRDEQLVAEITTALWKARARIDGWLGDHDDLAVLCSGLGQTYGRGRSRLANARALLDDESLHDWRKEVKYLWYQVRILCPAGENALHDLARLLRKLSGVLGDDHDLAELRCTVVESVHAGSDGDGSDILVGLIDERRANLQPIAWSLSRQVYVQEPTALVGSVVAHYRACRQRPAHQQPVKGRA